MKPRRGSLLYNISRFGFIVVAAFALAAFDAQAVRTKHPIAFDFPTTNGQEIAESATEVTLKWHICKFQIDRTHTDEIKVPQWGVEVWCASDGTKLYEGKVKTNEVTVTGLRPNRIYYAKVSRNWVRFEEITFSTGVPAAPAARELPPEFGDAGRYDRIPMPGGKAFDVGLTRFRGWTRVKVDRASKTEFTTVVPCTEYSRAWVLVKADPDPKKDRAFNLRLTRFVNGPWGKYLGRSMDAMVNVLVEIDKNPGRDLGDGFRLVEVPLDMGDIQDIIYSDTRGDFLETRGRYLDLEIMGRLIEGRNGFRDMRCDTDPRFTSAVTVYGLALEKPGAELRTRETQPGNIFADGERPCGTALVTLHRPGDWTLKLTSRDPDGVVMGVKECPVADSGEYVIDYPNRGDGWYSLRWELQEGGRTVVAHNASFAMLGRDTRTTEMGEQYSTWPDLGRWGGHYSPKADDPAVVDRQLAILSKAGFRRAFDVGYLPLETRRKWKIGECTAARFPSDWNYFARRQGETNLIAVIRRRLAENPNCKVAMLFHEDAPVGGPAPEIFGEEPDERRIAAGRKWIDDAIKYATFIRTNFPELKIQLGNSLVCGEFVARLVSLGFKEDFADSMGLEAIGGEVLPELQDPQTLQAAELMQLVAKHFGYEKWGLSQCFESNFRSDVTLGAEKQASFYVRDILLSYLWGMPDICIASESDQGNHYSMSTWGCVGLTTRYPYSYPKRAYVAVATATKLFDRVTGVRKIPTGDACVYAVEYARADGKAVTAFWTSRGLATLDVTAKDVEQFDMYGRKTAFGGTLEAGMRVWYLVGRPGAVTSVAVTGRRYPDDAKPADYTVVVKAEDAAEWTVASAPIAAVDNDFIKRGWPHRTSVPGALKSVDDPEMGRCLELELLDDGKSVSAPHHRYAAFLLKKPIRVTRPFKSIGCTIRGNSGWGEIYYVLEDAKGRRTVSCDVSEQGKLDREGLSALSFTGWNFIRFAVKPGASVRELCVDMPLWNWTDVKIAASDDVRIAGIVFSARMKPLFLNAAEPCRQVIRLKDIGVFE